MKVIIKEEQKPEYEAEVELHLEKMEGAFEVSQFENAGKHFSMPQGWFQLIMAGGETYRCSALVGTHFSVAKTPPPATF